METPNPSTLFDLIRHGEPRGGQRYRGHRDDPLSELGWQQMRAAIQTDDCWDHILTSPLLRCQEFARELGERLRLPVTVESNFKEIGFGEWEGQTPAQVEQRYGDHLRRFWQDAEKHPPPGGEAIGDFFLRVSQGWQHWQQQLTGQRVLLVCHGGVIRMVLGQALGLGPSQAMAAFQVPYACRSRLQIDQSEFGTLTSLVRHG